MRTYLKLNFFSKKPKIAFYVDNLLTHTQLRFNKITFVTDLTPKKKMCAHVCFLFPLYFLHSFFFIFYFSNDIFFFKPPRPHEQNTQICEICSVEFDLRCAFVYNWSGNFNNNNKINGNSQSKNRKRNFFLEQNYHCYFEIQI